MEVELFVPTLPAALRGGQPGATIAADLAGTVRSIHEYDLALPFRAAAGKGGPYVDWVLGGEAMRFVQRRMAREVNRSGFDVAFLNACRYSQTVPIAEWLEVPSVYFAQEIRRASFEAKPQEIARQFTGAARLVPLLRRPHEAVCRRRDRRAVAAVDRVLCNSRFAADLVATLYGVDPTVCYLGVDPVTFSPDSGRPQPAAARRSEPGGRLFTAISVGAMHPVKGHDLALRALASASRSSNVAARLHVVYEREPRPGFVDVLRGLAADSGVELDLHRAITDEELAALYRQSDVTLCAARLEPFGLTPLESMSCGTPVVAVAQGGYRESVRDGVDGYVVERSVDALGESIARVMRGELATGPQALSTYARTWGWQEASDRVLRQLRIAAAS